MSGNPSADEWKIDWLKRNDPGNNRTVTDWMPEMLRDARATGRGDLTHFWFPVAALRTLEAIVGKMGPDFYMGTNGPFGCFVGINMSSKPTPAPEATPVSACHVSAAVITPGSE